MSEKIKYNKCTTNLIKHKKVHIISKKTENDNIIVHSTTGML